MAAARGVRTSMVTTAAHQGRLQNSTLGTGELCRGLREAGEGRLDAAVIGHRDQGPETRLQRPMTRDQRTQRRREERAPIRFQHYVGVCGRYARNGRLLTVERSPRVAMDVHDCTPEPFSLYEEREQPEEDRKTCTGRWEDSNTGRRERRNTGRQHAYGAKHQECQGAVACVRSTRQVVDHEKHEEHEEHETHEGHGA